MTTTICSFCGKEINENSSQNEDKKYLYCPCGHGLIPRGSNSYSIKLKEEDKKMDEKKEISVKQDKPNKKESKIKKVTRTSAIRELLSQGKTAEEIQSMLAEKFDKKVNLGIIKSTIIYLNKK